MKFEQLPSVNLMWHDLKLQHGSFTIVGIEELFQLNVVCPLKIPCSSVTGIACDTCVLFESRLCGATKLQQELPCKSCNASAQAVYGIRVREIASKGKVSAVQLG